MMPSAKLIAQENCPLSDGSKTVSRLHENVPFRYPRKTVPLANEDDFILPKTLMKTLDMNFSSNFDSKYIHSITMARIYISILPMLLTVFTVVGNGFVIAAICFSSRLNRKSTSVLILNLALADFLIGAIVMPVAVMQIFTGGVWLMDRLFCRVWTSLDVICCTASIVTLCIISVDRFIGVTRPLRYSTLVTKRRLCLGVIIVWTFSVTVLLSTVRWQDPPTLDPTMCNVDNELEYVTYSVILSFFIPLCVIVIIYRKIYVITQNREETLSKPIININGSGSSKSSSSSTKSGDDVHAAIFVPLRIHYGGTGETDMNSQKRFFQMHMKTAKTLGLVVGAFIVCWLPFFVLYLINNLNQNCVPSNVLEIFTWLGYSNSALNPIIYAVSMRSFGNAFRDIFYRQIYFPMRTCCGMKNHHLPLYGFHSRRSSEAYTYQTSLNGSRWNSPEVSEHRRSVDYGRRRSRASIDHTHRSVLLAAHNGRSYSLACPTEQLYNYLESCPDATNL